MLIIGVARGGPRGPCPPQNGLVPPPPGFWISHYKTLKLKDITNFWDSGPPQKKIFWGHRPPPEKTSSYANDHQSTQVNSLGNLLSFPMTSKLLHIRACFQKGNK